MFYLCHHGIKGQKWGVRRFQNEDGTSTEAGKARRKKLIEKLKNMQESGKERSIERRRKKTLSTKSPQVLLKNMDLLTDDEFAMVNKRVTRASSLRKMSENNQSRVAKLIDRELNRSIDRVADKVSDEMYNQAVHQVGLFSTAQIIKG